MCDAQLGGSKPSSVTARRLKKEKRRGGMKNCRLLAFASLGLLISCTPAQPPPKVEATPLAAPIITHKMASGCGGPYDLIYVPGVYLEPYPSLPPKAEPDHIVLHLNDGTTIWGKPDYGRKDCTDYINCRRATLVLNPAWNGCTPLGKFYELATVDGRLVFDSNSWQITEPATKSSAYVGFACGQGFAVPTLTTLSNQTAQSDCSAQSASPPPGTMVAAAMALGAAYFNYRAAYGRVVQCVSYEQGGATRSTKCY